jgi:translocation and assembly module TamA
MRLMPYFHIACANQLRSMGGALVLLCAHVCWAQDTALLPSAGAASEPAPGLVYRLEVQAPSSIKKLLLSYLDLARFQSVTDANTITREELTRLANAAPEQAKALLETQGYFSAQAKVSRQEDEGGLPVVVLQITPGVRSTVGSVDLQAEGALQTQALVGDGPAQKLLQQWRLQWTLPPKEAFRQSDWTSAKNSSQALLRAHGYPGASWSATRAVVDAQAHSVALSGVVDSGPLFRFGAMRIEGLSRYNDQAIRNLADFTVGMPSSEKRLLDFQERLGKLGLFESVAVEMDANPATADAAPVTVTVREQHLQQATTGVGYSDKSGPRTTLEHRHRRPFGWNWQSYNKFELGSNLRSWEGELVSDPTANRYRKLLATSVSRLEADNEVTAAARFRIGRSLDTEHIERLIFGELLRSTLRNQAANEQAQALSVNYNWIWRDLDSIILPTRGLSSSIQFGLGHAQSNFASSGAFARIYTRNTVYWPFLKSWHAQLRLEAGQVLVPSKVGLPDQLLFRAGGDESVRGYALRALGPLKNGVVSSGRSLLTASAEIAHPFTANIPNLWWAAFVDAGNSATQARDIRLALGYGLGIRFRSPVGPLRVDVAYGEKVKKARVHLSIGIAF